jgi:hypothetical protein
MLDDNGPAIVLLLIVLSACIMAIIVSYLEERER